MFGRYVRVFVVEEEENTKLCGPAYANEVVVYNGSIYGIPRTEKWRSYFEEGVVTGIRYIDSFAYLAARKIEEAAMTRESNVVVRVRVVENLSDINMCMHDNLRRYILWKGGKIDVRGPVFVTVKAEID